MREVDRAHWGLLEPQTEAVGASLVEEGEAGRAYVPPCCASNSRDYYQQSATLGTPGGELVLTLVPIAGRPLQQHSGV